MSEHLAPWLAFLACVAAASALYWFVQRWFMQTLARRLEQLRASNAQERPEPPRTSLTALGLTALAQLLFLPVLGVGIDLAGAHPRSAQTTALFLGLVLLLLAIQVHRLPQHDRTPKYVLLWLGTFAVGAKGILDSSMRQQQPGMLLLLLLYPVILLTAAVAHRGDRSAGAPPSLAAFVRHRLNMALAPSLGVRAFLVFLAVRSTAMLPVMLVQRYFARRDVARSPVLYLRSYSDHLASTFFGKALAPAVGARAVLIGLVHEMQTSRQLHRQAALAHHADVYVLSDADWQRWVVASLQGSLGVIIDVSVMTPSLRWEIEQALHHLPPARVLLVSRTDVDESLSAGADSYRYSLDTRPDRTLARERIAAWTEQLIATTAVEDPDDPTAAVPARSGPIVVAIVLAAVFAIGQALADAANLRAALVLWRYLAPVAHGTAAVLVICAFVQRGDEADTGPDLVLLAGTAFIALSSIWLVALERPGVLFMLDLLRGVAWFVVAGRVVLGCLARVARNALPLDVDSVILSMALPFIVPVFGLLAMAGVVPAVVYAVVYAVAITIAAVQAIRLVGAVSAPKA
jgi:hypothetical protein